MKTIFVFILFAAVLQSTYGLTFEVLKAIIAKDQEICLKKAPVSEKIRKGIEQKELLEDEVLKKYALCVGILFGFLNEDGTYNLETMKHTTANVIGNNQFDALIDQCTKNRSNDPVASVWNLAKCINDNVHSDTFKQFTDAFWNI